MTFLSQLILWGCFLRFGIFLTGISTSAANPTARKKLTCNYNIGLIRSSDRWTTQRAQDNPPHNIIQDQYLNGKLEQAPSSDKESGIQCTLDQSGFVRVCCGLRNFETVGSTFWGENISSSFFVFLVVILLFLMFILSWALLLTFKYLETLELVWLSESTETD